MADHDLIAAVAEGVMGWTVFQLADDTPATGTYLLQDRSAFILCSNDRRQSEWNPLTDHNDAFGVLAMFSDWVIAREIGQHRGEYEAELWRHEEPGLGLAHADTFCRAVCLAALKCVGAKVE